MTRSGTIGESVTLGIKFYSNSQLFDPYNVATVVIYDQQTGGNIIASIAPTRVSIGYYQVTWDIPSAYSPASYYDQWTWTAEHGMESTTQRYSFDIVADSTMDGEPSTIQVDVACRPRPTWDHMIGLRVLEDAGNGMGLRFTWGKALSDDTDKQVHYNIYYASTRIDVFEDGPKAITTSQQVILNLFTPGDLNYCAVKATEFDPDEFNLTTLARIGTDVYRYPEGQTLQEAIEYGDGYEATVKVEDNSGFPAGGFLLVGSEVMKYSTKGDDEFYIADYRRGIIGTIIDTHEVGESVTLWHGIQDGNTNIMLRTATWHYTQGTPRNVEEIGEVNVNADGYRAANTDILTTDLTASDDNTENFPSYDYTGYHRPSLQATFSGECVRSYVGGEFDGGRGFFFQDRSLARLETLLGVTGEPVILLRRKWSGKRCNCIGLHRESMRVRCPTCYGVGFSGGYDRFVNPRPISESSANTDGMIMIRVHPYTDDLELVLDQGIRQPVELTAWTLTVPTIKDRDVIQRRNEDGSEEFRYEILSTIRNKLFFGQTGKQQFVMRRLDKTDILYQYKIEGL